MLPCSLCMASSSPPPRLQKRVPADDGDIAAAILKLVAGAPADRPLPTTRELGKRHRVASATAYRMLQKLTQEGTVWQHPTSGRFYPSSARVLLDRPKPVACVIRRLELDSEQYRELLEGISLGCGDLRRSMLLWHDQLLVNHPLPREAPVFASVAEQRAILEEFLDRHGEPAGGFILDHVWDDEALHDFRRRLQPAVILFRTCNVDGITSVRADFRSGAFKVLTHLLGRGYEYLIPIQPFANDPAVAEFFAALNKAADETGCRDRISPPVMGSTEVERTSLVRQLTAAKRRTALICPEDNVATFIVGQLRAAGNECPARIGMFSAMGTDVATKSGLSCLRYDYRAMGKRAVEALESSVRTGHTFDAELIQGVTT